METECNPAPPHPETKGFRVNTSIIETVRKTDQATELQDLDISVYDSSVLEKGILAQVDEALKKQNNGGIEDGEILEAAQPSTSKEGMSDSINNMEKYLLAQEELHKKWRTLPKKPKKRSFIKEREVKRPLKKELDLRPKKIKKKKKEKLGSKSVHGFRAAEADQQPGEKHSFYLNEESDSEYLPSSSEVDSSQSDLNEEVFEKKNKAQARKRRPKKEHYTDDSDVEQSDSVKPRKKGLKEQDDGDIDLYHERMSAWADRVDFTNSFHPIRDDYKCPTSIWDNLYSYQKQGVEWLVELDSQECGGILGDEMGLGKTVQVIAFLSSVYFCRTARDGRGTGLGPTLIVCPTTVMHQWVREFHTWFPMIRVAILHESGTYPGKDRTKLISAIHDKKTGIVVTSYSSLVQNKEAILFRRWHYVVLDEGHKIRNPEAKVTVVAKELDTPHRLILSGSPLQNNLRELWSLFDFVFPGKLGTLQAFMTIFAAPIIEGGYANASQRQVVTSFKCATMLRDTITPYLLRRQKSEVGETANLPQKTEQVLFCRLSEEQRTMYKGYVEGLSMDEMVHGKTKLFVALHILRKICNHPDMHSGGPARNFQLDMSSSSSGDEKFGFYKRAGKMIVIETLLRVWKGQNHRVLLFTQGVTMLCILENFVRKKGYKYLRLDGGTSIGSRQPMIDKFNQDPSYYIMLLTTRVGGLGVNLTGANRVIIYDPDWNPATDTQARERAWRIGQRSDVTIYRLITAGTIEEKIYHRQIYKQFLSNKVLKDPKQRRFFKSNDIMELFTLSETVTGGTTETAAIFAGTESEINSESVKNAKGSEKISIKFSPEKIEEMKKRAMELSKKFGATSQALPEKKEELIYGPDGNLLPTPAKKEENNNKQEKKEEVKKKKRKRKGEFFDGVRVPHLVKSKKAKIITVEHPESQNDYVLHKLFSKSGIEIAMKHDNIMEGGPSDYAIIEEEADKIARNALKALRNSRCENPPMKKPVFRTQVNSSGHSSTSGLLEKIRARNLETEGPLEGNLLREMISWLCNQGGTATTCQIVDVFSAKVDGGKSPLFKSLLKNIAQFYRGPDQIGYWTIREEFK